MRRFARSFAAAAIGLAVVTGSSARAAGDATHDKSLQAISCVGGSFCLAVGDLLRSLERSHLEQFFACVRAAPRLRVLQLNDDLCRSRHSIRERQSWREAERWNGSNSTRLGKPTGSRLDAVYCPTPGWCMATGESPAGQDDSARSPRPGRPVAGKRSPSQGHRAPRATSCYCYRARARSSVWHSDDYIASSETDRQDSSRREQHDETPYA